MSAQLAKAAQAVIDRWDSPQWEWTSHGPTADLIADLRKALAAFEAAPQQAQAPGWQPIETAPKDGALILLLQEKDSNTGAEPITAYWSDSEGWTDNARGSWWGFNATHWMPLPAAPQQGSKS